MSREVKRVALDFDWPINEVWKGFKNNISDTSVKCTSCKGNGASPEYNILRDRWYGYGGFHPSERGSEPYTVFTPEIRAHAERNVNNSAPRYYGTGEEAIIREATRLCELFNSEWCHHLNDNDVAALITANRLSDFTHTWSSETGWVEKDPPYVPTAREVNLWSISSFGHDAINCWSVVYAELERFGLPSACADCDGEGSLWPNEADKLAYESWKATEPPTGEGWQLWESISEGSPQTPVFATKEGLVEHLINYGDHWDSECGRGGWSPEAANSIVENLFHPSMIAEHTEDGVIFITPRGELDLNENIVHF